MKRFKNIPRSTQTGDARALYRSFHGRSADRIMLNSHGRLIPPVVVQLGTLAGLIYRSDKWTPGNPRNYIHMMESAPRLVCDTTGRQLYVLGGNYRVTERGIEG